MTRYRLDKFHGMAPGDIRALRRPDVISLSKSVRDRPDWPSILCAFTVAVCRGVTVIWED